MAEKKVRRKKKEDKQLTGIRPNEQVGVSATATPYEVTTWCGMPLYKCLLCKFDTLKEDAIFTHIEEHRLGKRSGETSPSVPPREDGEQGEVFEVELKEIDSRVDPDGNVHKTYTVKE